MTGNRKKIGILILSVIFLCLFLNYEKLAAIIRQEVLTVPLIGDISEISQEEDTQNREENVSLLSYNDGAVAYDRESNTILIPQDLYAEAWEGKLRSEEGELYFKEDACFKQKEEAIGNGHCFELYLYKDNGYSRYQVVFTGMPVMCITSSGNSVMDADEREIFSGVVQVYDPYHSSTRLQVADCEYNVRGGSSYYYEKSNYKLELTKEKLSFLGMRKDDDWVLNSLYDDAGLIHNKVSSMMWQEIAAYNHVPNDDGITMEYIEVFKDNEYIGVYALTERVDQKSLSLGKNDILYKCRSDRIPQEHNYTNDNTDEMRPIFVLEYPRDPADEDWEPLKDWVNYYLKEQFETFEEGEALLNMENALDYNLFTLLTCGVDNMRKNVYFIAEYQSDGTYVFKKVPWDMNATWGNPWVDDPDCNYTIYDPAYVEDVSTWCTDISTLYFYDETKVASLLEDRWWELREAGVITKEKITEMVTTQFAYLYASGAYQRNYAKWPHGSEYWKDEYIYEYVDGRIDFLDGYFGQLYQDTISEAVYNGVDYSAEFDVRYYWEKNYESLSELYDYDRQALLEHYVLYGKPYGLVGKKVR